MALLVLRPTVGQTGLLEHLFAELAFERVAGHKGLTFAGNVVLELLVRALETAIEHRDSDATVAERLCPRRGHVHARVVPLEDPLRVGHAQERRRVVPRIRERPRFSENGVSDLLVADRSVTANRRFEERLVEDARDAWAGADSHGKVACLRRDRHRADRAEVGDDLPARLRNRSVHLRWRSACSESNDRDPERVRLVACVGGSSGEERRGANRQENKPLHRNPGFGSERARLYGSIPQVRATAVLNANSISRVL